MTDEKNQTTITVNKCEVNRFLIEEYFPFTRFHESAISFNVVAFGECNFTAKLQIILIVQMAAMFVCNILNLESTYRALCAKCRRSDVGPMTTAMMNRLMTSSCR